MKASFIKEQRNAKNYGSEKETVTMYNVVAYKPDQNIYYNPTKLKEIITVRCYMARRSDGSSPVYASIWLHDQNKNHSGRGSASGYGYHKQSAAIGDAITSAGIQLDQDINGRGESAIREALEAIAIELGHTKENILIIEN